MLPPLPRLTRPSDGSCPRAAYLHVPFCHHRCGYCNFALIADRGDMIESYLKAVQLELCTLPRPHEIDTLFVGGGTPTYLSPTDLEYLLRIFGEWFPLAEGGEFTVEANPSDITDRKVDVLVRAGATRISLGAQSFSPKKLEVLERAHTPDEIMRAAALIQEYKMDLSVDLIFGSPGESLSLWENDLRMALSLKPDHISTYGLTFEKGSMFYGRMLRGELTPVNENTDLRMYELAIDTLPDSGFDHYEVSNFARPGHRCRHNEGYWTQKQYFAIGPGASRFIDGTRETNHRSTSTYVKRLLNGSSPVAFRESLSPESAAREAIVFGLRRLEGVSKKDFFAHTGFDLCQLLGEPLNRFINNECLIFDSDYLKLTRKGLLVSDSIWPEFLAE